MQSLESKVAIVSGASSGIGRAAAGLFARHGAKVVVGARREPELKILVNDIRSTGGEAVAVIGDACEEGYATALVQRALDAFGRLDVAFNNVGGMGATGDSAMIALDGLSRTLELNLTSAFLGAKHQLPHLLAGGGGSLIFTSSFVGPAVGFPQAAAYAAAKAGLIGLTRALATEFGAKGVRVNALVPGSIDTPAYREEVGTAEQRAFMAGLNALKRIGTAEEVAQAALFLGSDASTFVTGTAFVIDGGLAVTRT